MRLALNSIHADKGDADRFVVKKTVRVPLSVFIGIGRDWPWRHGRRQKRERRSLPRRGLEKPAEKPDAKQPPQALP